MNPAAAAPRRLHPATLVSRSLKLIPQMAAGGAGYVAIVEQQGWGRVLAVAAIAAAIGVAAALVSWWRFTYRVAPGEIVIDQGVLRRERRVIPFDRVQDISIERGLLYRLFGTARVRIETGGSGTDEGDLDSIALADAHRMRDIVRGWHLADDGAAEAKPAEAEPLLFGMSLRRVLFSGLFNFSLVFLAVLFAGLQYVEQITDIGLYEPERWAIPAEAAAGAVTLQVTLIIIALLWLAGMVAGVLRTLSADYGYRLTRTEAGLRRRRGLFTLYEAVIPIRRMQAAAFDSGLLARALGRFGLVPPVLAALRRGAARGRGPGRGALRADGGGASDPGRSRLPGPAAAGSLRRHAEAGATAAGGAAPPPGDARRGRGRRARSARRDPRRRAACARRGGGAAASQASLCDGRERPVRLVGADVAAALDRAVRKAPDAGARPLAAAAGAAARHPADRHRRRLGP
jgi:membrane protein YdbS with pleckstrin-like domain